MICKNCGAENPDGNMFCAYCGSKTDYNANSNVIMQNSNVQYNTAQSSNAQFNNTEKNTNGGMDIASMVLGIVGIVFLCTTWIGLICSILAIVFACIEKKHNGFRTTGLVLGIIGISLRIIVPILGIAGLIAGANVLS